MRKVFILGLLSLSLQAQTPPVKRLVQLPPSWVDRALFSSDALLRSLDAQTTYALLNDPCRCFRELDPIAPKGRGAGQISMFQSAAGSAVMSGANYLRSKGHTKWARVLVLIDIGSEIWAVQNNMRLDKPEGLK